MENQSSGDDKFKILEELRNANDPHDESHVIPGAPDPSTSGVEKTSSTGNS